MNATRFTRNSARVEVLWSSVTGRWRRSSARQHLAVAALCATLAIGLLAPMASNTIIPAAPDHANHIAIIVQARMALDEGQFPLRVAPWQHDGFRYPLFQFYSPLPYTVGGLVYRWITPENPFVAYKVVLWGSLVFAGFFTYLTACFLTKHRAAALLAGVTYMSAPYVLINVHARGAFTEAVAQALLPMVLYCSLRYYFARPLSPWLFAAGVCWAGLALAHTITYFYGALFIGLLFAIVAIQRRGVSAGLWRVGTAFALGCLLAMYALAPTLTANYLNIRDNFGSIFAMNWLTPLTTLLSPVSLPPEPQPAHATTAFLNPSVGWPTLLAVALFIYTYRQLPVTLTGPSARRIGAGLVVVFALALFMTWSPVDFWLWLPVTANVAQFSYRFLAHVALAGALLVGYAITTVFRDGFDLRHASAGLLLILVAHGSFLPPLASTKRTIEQIVAEPDAGYGRYAYLLDRAVRPSEIALGGKFALPIANDDGWMRPASTSGISREMLRRAPNPELVLEGRVPPAGHPEPSTLFVYIDEKEWFHTTLVSGPLTIRRSFAGLPMGDPSRPMRLLFYVDRPVVTPTQTEQRPLSIYLQKLEVTGLALEDAAVVLPTQCDHQADSVRCHVAVTSQAGLVQLPILYYPDLLTVAVNGQAAPYFMLSARYPVAALRLGAGHYEVTARFRGLWWANWISGVAWIGTLAGFIVSMVRTRAIAGAHAIDSGAG